MRVYRFEVYSNYSTLLVDFCNLNGLPYPWPVSIKFIRDQADSVRNVYSVEMTEECFLALKLAVPIKLLEE